MQISEIDIQASQGLVLPYSASEIASSPLSESEVLTHRCHPGLSGLVSSKQGLVPVIFVDKLPTTHMLYGRLIDTDRLAPDERGNMIHLAGTLIHVQHHFEAWHFLSHLENARQASTTAMAVFLEWKPGSLQAAIAEHDAMFLKADLPGDEMLVGSDFEKESLARYYLSTGLSSFANIHLASGVVDALMNSPLTRKNLRSPSVVSGIAVPVTWTRPHD
ncbi:hypothetical protein [Pseudomonas sp. S1(2024)]|uniref:hypothetical protein n=1 Tax=Pseudomonas sp. S1(2024) TaxID=3390191 RepID=UPI00397B9705